MTQAARAHNSKHRFAIILAAAALLFSAVAVAQSPDPLLQQADDALQKKDYAAAAQALENYLIKNPADYRAEFNLAYAYSLSGRRSDAIGRYQDVVATHPDVLAARLNLGILLLEAGNAAEAERHLRAVVEKEPDNATANSYLADSLLALKRNADAAEAYERVLKLKPSDARAHLKYARLLEESKPSVAEEHLRRAVELEPGLDEAWLELASLLETSSGDAGEPLAEAAGIYTRYLDQHADRRDIRIRLGQLYARQKKFSEAATQFEAARAAGENSIAVAKDLLQAYLNSGNRQGLRQRSTDKEIALVREILAAENGNADMHLLYGRFLMDHKQYREAADEFNKAAALLPRSAEPYENLASATYLLGDYSAAIGALSKVSDLKQDTPGSYFLRAICFDKLHLLQPALDNYQSFLAVSKGQNPDQEFQARQRSKVLILDIRKGIGGRRK